MDYIIFMGSLFPKTIEVIRKVLQFAYSKRTLKRKEIVTFDVVNILELDAESNITHLKNNI
ncbi:hypothetical protein Musp01_28550 [Muricauda sp. NBRC 101325]|nr:hypothetical protein Musp01_28550 [Muricauda sp. NBRC 101325]